MDIWVAPRIEIAQRLVAALQAFGVPDPQIDPAWFVDPESIFGIGNYPYRIEIFCAIPGVAFDDCYARKIFVSAHKSWVKLQPVGGPHDAANTDPSRH
jgi:hypothetical protein